MRLFQEINWTERRDKALKELLKRRLRPTIIRQLSSQWVKSLDHLLNDFDPISSIGSFLDPKRYNIEPCEDF